MGTNIYARLHPDNQERKKLALKIKDAIMSNDADTIYYIELNIRDILINLCDHIVIESDKEYPLILAFLNRLLNTKSYKLYKPV